MGSFIDMENAGSHWSVFWDQGLGDIDLVIPKPYRLDNSVPIAGSRFEESNQIIVLGVAYTVTTGTGPLGIRLVESVPGAPTRTIWECSSATAAVVTGSAELYWKLQAGGTASPISDGGRLSVVRIGSVASAQLTVWGVHTTSRGRNDYWATPPFSFS